MLPQSPDELLEKLFTIFPQYRASYQGPLHEEPPTYHSVLISFSFFFGPKTGFSEKQLLKFGTLINEAVLVDGPLENAFGTCFLEHLHQINATRLLRPYLSDLAFKKTHA